MLDTENPHYYNGLVNKRQAELSVVEDYLRVTTIIATLTEMAWKLSSKADLDEGRDKKTWRTILADVLTMKSEILDKYSDMADEMQEWEEKAKQLGKEV